MVPGHFLYMHRRIFAFLLVLGLAILACAGPAAPSPTAPAFPTVTVPAVATPDNGGVAAGELEVRGLSSYIDSFGYYHLVGEVFNATEAPVTAIELLTHVADQSGQAAVDADERPLDGQLFSPLLYSLAPGESAPFDFFRLLPDGANLAGWQASVTVATFAAEALERATVEIVSTRLAANPSGTVYLTGELVNPGSAPVEVSGVAGALLAPDGRLLAANASRDFGGLLAPAGDPGGGDRTPFVIAIDGPAEAGAEARFYVDAVAGGPLPAAAQVAIEVTNRYADEFDDLHLVANVTNSGSEMLTIRLVAGLYAADGTVLDASSVTTPIFVAPGATVPVSFDYFYSLNRSVESQALVDHVTVQVDPVWTYAIPYSVAEIETANEEREAVGTAQYSFRGDVVNTSDVPLTSVTLILGIYDGAGQLVATNWINVYPETETLAPGDSLPFDMSVYLPTGVDVSNYAFSTLAQGSVEE